MYRALLFKWYNRTSETGNPDNNCLAIARSVYCAYAFPKCVDYLRPKQPLCDWLCDLYLERCETEVENMELMCEKTSSEAEACSWASHKVLSSLLLLATSIFVFT